MIYNEKQLEEIRGNLFDTANSHAGNHKGNAAVWLHEAANSINRAQKSLAAGNPASEPIPASLLMRSCGLLSDGD